MRLLHLFLLYFLSQFTVFAQYTNLSDGRSLALSGTIGATGENYVGRSNPAGLARNTDCHFGLHYFNRFMLKELGVQSICAVIPVRSGSFEGGIHYFGTRAFNESKISLSYGHLINSWIAAGIDLNYHYLSIGAINMNHSAVSGNLGMICRPLKNLILGIFYVNPTNISFNYDYSIEYPSSLECGITYNETERFLISGKLGWNDFQWVDIAFGAEVFITKYFAIRGGIKVPSSMSYSFGAGWQSSRVKFDLGFEQHAVLGLSSSASIIINFVRHAN